MRLMKMFDDFFSRALIGGFGVALWPDHLAVSLSGEDRLFLRYLVSLAS